VPVVKLTKKFVADAKWEGSVELYRDTEVRGLMLSVNQTSKTWKCQHDLWVDRQVKTIRKTLGTTEEYDLDAARRWAREMANMVSKGINPNGKPKVAPEGPEGWTVGKLWDEYEGDMRRRGLAETTIKQFREHLEKYLYDWRSKPISELRKSTCREKHALITRLHKNYSANQAMRSLRAAWNFAKSRDDHGRLLENPAGGVDFHPERRREGVIEPADLPAWAAKVEALPNPLRRKMHRFGLFSGLRPGTLVTLKRDWIDLQARRVRIPAASMKSRRVFDLPLSGRMVALLEESLAVSRILEPKTEWLYPTRSKTGEVIATQVWKEKTLGGETGHILRKTYRTQALAIGVPTAHARALLDHRQPGIEDHYVLEAGLFNDLLVHQERISSHLARLLGSARP
jgi:integrase